MATAEKGTLQVGFEWDHPKEMAAQLLAEDEFTDQEIAAKVGISIRQFYRWKSVPEFSEKVASLVQEFGSAISRHAIAKRTRRIASMNKRWLDLHRIAAERSEDLDMQTVPGGKTGLIVRQKKVIGSGPNAKEVDEYAVDTAMLKEWRELEKQAAIEAGQWAGDGSGVNVNVGLQIGAAPVQIYLPDNERDETGSLETAAEARILPEIES